MLIITLFAFLMWCSLNTIQNFLRNFLRKTNHTKDGRSSQHWLYIVSEKNAVVKSVYFGIDRYWNVKNANFSLTFKHILKLHWLAVVFMCSTDMTVIGSEGHRFTSVHQEQTQIWTLESFKVASISWSVCEQIYEKSAYGLADRRGF